MNMAVGMDSICGWDGSAATQIKITTPCHPKKQLPKRSKSKQRRRSSSVETCVSSSSEISCTPRARGRKRKASRPLSPEPLLEPVVLLSTTTKSRPASDSSSPALYTSPLPMPVQLRQQLNGFTHEHSTQQPPLVPMGIPGQLGTQGFGLGLGTNASDTTSLNGLASRMAGLNTQAGTPGAGAPQQDPFNTLSMGNLPQSRSVTIPPMGSTPQLSSAIHGVPQPHLAGLGGMPNHMAGAPFNAPGRPASLHQQAMLQSQMHMQGHPGGSHVFHPHVPQTNFMRPPAQSNLVHVQPPPMNAQSGMFNGPLDPSLRAGRPRAFTLPTNFGMFAPPGPTPFKDAEAKAAAAAKNPIPQTPGDGMSPEFYERLAALNDPKSTSSPAFGIKDADVPVPSPVRPPPVSRAFSDPFMGPLGPMGSPDPFNVNRSGFNTNAAPSPGFNAFSFNPAHNTQQTPRADLFGRDAFQFPDPYTSLQQFNQNLNGVAYSPGFQPQVYPGFGNSNHAGHPMSPSVPAFGF